MADLTNKSLQASVARLEKKITRNADYIAADAKAIDEEARDATRVAGQIAAKGVDRYTVAETHEFAKITLGFSGSVMAYASSGYDTAKSAKAAGDQARASHDGIQQAVDRSTVDTIHNVHADWFEQQ